MTNQITIHNVQLPIAMYLGRRVVTFAMIDKVHQRIEGTARKRFNDNKDRFIDGEDYYLIEYSKMSAFRTSGIEINPRGTIVLTESGYLMLVKSFTDDLAWQVQRQLVNNYFRAPVATNAISLPDFTNPAAAARAWADQVELKQHIAAQRDEAIRTKALIGSRREATAMATAAAAVRQRDRLAEQLGQSTKHATITSVAKRTGTEYHWKPLKDWCRARGIDVLSVHCPRYGTVKSWPAEAWFAVYDVDLSKVFLEVNHVDF
ncbi:MAG: ORF6N domain-containing protein [Enterobacteriaceae bacterium]